LHPVRLDVIVWLRGSGEPDAQPWELMLKDGNGGGVQVVADQTQVQIPALRTAVGPLDPRRDDVRVARRDDALTRQPVQAGAYRPLGQPGVADQRSHGRERADAVRPRVVGQADEYELARAGRLTAAIGRNRG
jgi:hypothetical protein